MPSPHPDPYAETHREQPQGHGHTGQGRMHSSQSTPHQMDPQRHPARRISPSLQLFTLTPALPTATCPSPQCPQLPFWTAPRKSCDKSQASPPGPPDISTHLMRPVRTTAPLPLEMCPELVDSRKCCRKEVEGVGPVHQNPDYCRAFVIKTTLAWQGLKEKISEQRKTSSRDLHELHVRSKTLTLLEENMADFLHELLYNTKFS